jgi:hypothetical protein
MQQAAAPAKKSVSSSKVERTNISLSRPEDIRYWTQALGMGEEQLRLLVRMHGTNVEPILAALNRKRAA